MSSRRVCVFDCETVPDVEFLRSQWGCSGSDLEVCEQAFVMQKEKNGSTFLPHPFHKIVSLAAVLIDDSGNFLRVGCFANGKDEREILGKFLAYVNQKSPRLVSFNGRGFDMPMMLLRAMKYNISVPVYFEVNDPSVGISKWENYRYRYSEQFHTDLYDSLGSYGTGERSLRLDTVCAMCGLPGKYDVHGDDVYKLYFAGEQERIDEYCESDVLNTYWLLLKYEILKGNLSLEDYALLLASFAEKIPDGKGYSDVFRSYIERELDNIKI
ncbi:MAG: 3'-5' exonuclease [Wolinella sp.]